MTSKTALMLMGIACLLMLQGCKPKAAEPTPDVKNATKDATKNATKDAKQSKTTITSPLIKAASASHPKHISRIISLAPNLTEILFALGAGDRVVGVTKFCDYPKEAKVITKIGGFIDPDMETIIKQKPDLVLGMASGPVTKLPKRLEAIGVSHMFIQMKTIDETLKGIVLIGETIGKAKEANALVKEMTRALKPHVAATAPSTLFVLGHKPMIVAGPGSFGAELIALAGGKNAVADDKRAYPALDIEKVIALNPSVIIDATMTATNKNAGTFWQTHKQLDAVKNKRVYPLHNPSLLRPGPRLPDAKRTMLEMIHPDTKP